jgi:hypothetical protein
VPISTLGLTSEQEIGLRASLDPQYQNLSQTELYELLSERLQNTGLSEELAEGWLSKVGKGLVWVGKKVVRAVPSVISGGVKGLAFGGPVGAAIGAGGGLVKGFLSSPRPQVAPPPPYQVAPPPPYPVTQPYPPSQPYDPYAYGPYGPSEPYQPGEPYPPSQPYDPYAYGPYGPYGPSESIGLEELLEPTQPIAPQIPTTSPPVAPQIPTTSQAPGAIQRQQKGTAIAQLIQFLQSSVLPQALTSVVMGPFGKKDLTIGGLRVSQGDVLNLLNKLTSSVLKEAAETYTVIPEERYILESGKERDPLNLDDRMEALWELLQKQPEFRDSRGFDE